jgi:hypothetical protein
VIEDDIITADLDDIDEGLAMELGIAYGVNYMLDLIAKFVSRELPCQASLAQKLMKHNDYSCP